MKFALISVSNKQNITIISNFLLENNYNIISTGGTYKYLITNIDKKYHKNIISVEEFTGFPEILNGRVKTLHPKIYGGILYDSDIKSHKNDFEKYNNSNYPCFNLTKIDIVIVNLYPFKEVIQQNNDIQTEIENIDIGGVSLLRAGAKNYKNVVVLCNPLDYIKYIQSYNYVDNLINFRRDLAAKAFEHISDYDNAITNYFNKNINYRKYKTVDRLKYGCNPYQNNSFVLQCDSDKTEFPFKILNGNPGYINYLDCCQSWLLVNEVGKALNTVCCASFKHTAPAGVAISKYLLETNEEYVYDVNNINDSPSSIAFIKARNSDALSSFGDFIAISGVVDEKCAKLIKREVSDGIVAFDYTSQALEILKTKKKGKYIILQGKYTNNYNTEYREINNIALCQQSNYETLTYDDLNNVQTKNNIIDNCKKDDLILATITLKYTPSNSIVLADKGQVIGVGAGQQNRVDCIKLAGNKAFIFKMRFHDKCINLLNKFKEDVKRQDRVNAIIKYINNDFLHNELINWKNLFEENNNIELLTNDELSFFKENLDNIVLSSDAFFPFRDNIDYAQRYGVKYILNPGGSIQDENIINACDEYNIFMAISNKRFFYH